jgi:hypothetical protein
MNEIWCFTQRTFVTLKNVQKIVLICNFQEMQHLKNILILLDRYFNRHPCLHKPIFALWTLLWLLQWWTWNCDRCMECHLRNFARPTNWVFNFQGTLLFLIAISPNNCNAILCKQIFLSFVIMGFTNFVKRTYLILPLTRL